ncbi:MAG: TRAP transporter substrate-binding protein [Clostridiales bacterium]|nr:TRAP transporter substrate-binding protein [Clostridiales bacterium]
MKKLLVIGCALAMATALITGCGSGSKESYVFRYAENQPQDYPTTKGAYKFAEIVEEKTDGRIKVEVYYGAQLGDEKSVLEQMQFGAIDFARVSLSPLSEFAPALNVLQMPYLYDNGEHMWKVLDGEIGDEFLKTVEAASLYALSWYDAGARSFYNTEKEIHTLEDMKGLNIRVQESALMMGIVSALGANPTPMTYSEVYSGLQTGVIQGAENNWPSYESTSHYEVAKYFVLDEHTRVPELQVISKMTMDKLSKDDQKIIREAAIESALYERELWAEREKASEEKVRAGGAIITEISAEEKVKFQEAVQPLYEEFVSEYLETVDKIRATK